jgi:hypothetical protein
MPVVVKYIELVNNIKCGDISGSQGGEREYDSFRKLRHVVW